MLIKILDYLGGNHVDDGGITRLDLLGEVLELLAGTTVNFLLQFLELAGDVSGVAIQDWGVTVTDFTWVVQDDDLSGEVNGTLGWIVLGVGGNITTLDILDRDVLDVETNIVTWFGLWEGFVVHFNRLDFSGELGWSESNNHTLLHLLKRTIKAYGGIYQ